MEELYPSFYNRPLKATEQMGGQFRDNIIVRNAWLDGHFPSLPSGSASYGEFSSPSSGRAVIRDTAKKYTKHDYVSIVGCNEAFQERTCF